MKTTVEKSSELDQGYPYLGEYMHENSLVVLFTGPNQGVNVTLGMRSTLSYGTNWAEREFIRLPKGSKVTIEQ